MSKLIYMNDTIKLIGTLKGVEFQNELIDSGNVVLREDEDPYLLIEDEEE